MLSVKLSKYVMLDLYFSPKITGFAVLWAPSGSASLSKASDAFSTSFAKTEYTSSLVSLKAFEGLEISIDNARNHEKKKVPEASLEKRSCSRWRL